MRLKHRSCFSGNYESRASAAMSQPMVKDVLKMGFKKSLVKYVIKQKLILTGKTHFVYKSIRPK